ncbi:rab11 family-interacting protein 2 [Nephila pilipes]|uniref:Rab11 family-interacting protein 2 n=1 Tax=Nephila pilipes TaxID=299642 RepID=A0A8X6U8D4_NEPPI|nr:rab11 family-interacting protein 2 [Nephila pilipes]
MWSPTHVQVTVQRARNLQNKGRKGTNDAFVLIQMGKEKFQTTIQEKATDPEWYEECDLTLIGRDSDVSLTVYHRNILGLEEFLGQTSVSLRGIESFDRPFTKWYPLKGKTEKSEDKNRGELEVRIAFIVRRCSDTQSLNDLSFKKKKHSIKNLAASVGHKIQKLPSRSMSLRNLDPRKRLERIKEKRMSSPSELGSTEEDGFDELESSEEFNQIPMKRHGALYSSTMSLPQSAMITSSIQEAESVEELSQTQEEAEELSDSSNSVESQGFSIPKPPIRKNHFTAPETKLLNHGEWTNRILSHSKESPIARSETNLIEALRSESPARKGRFETLRHNLRRHTLQLSESPELSVLALSNHQKKNRIEALKSESPKNNLPVLDGIPPEVIQQYEKMNQKDLVLLAIKQQGDLERQRDKITDLENYLDNLLVRVMETTPRILQNPYTNRLCQR